ncbi:LpxA family transferase [Pseudomonas haemolytica]|uniref:LpxA family transferase n=1 Tax=Pseudomonas haemolytica TaxID=2600065 RepID=A0A5P1DHV4_9PSED|nr:LpxA family transferase [Pseudomonas haemolytica]MBJ2246908.1 LpxA family transferase [Pseudomonas haemolytica]MBJ2274516.1 LpxA family transferase [Pseudomonas haemolytica]MBK3449646.1 LpxA family transferase [Pseudomonas haemolytica]MBK3457445.1 LpxA family transferase [Pseudomonas haemolytica]MRJ39179.1 LpxA family transferase [Pseudomonas haemolytica]
MIRLTDYIAHFAQSPLAPWADLAPWALVIQAPVIVRQLLTLLPADDYDIHDDIAIHRSATVESGAVLKGPLIIGAHCFIASGSLLRGGCWVDERCIIGPGAELKTTLMFSGSKLAHFNFVGDSVLGHGINLEAGSIVANYRNERDDKEIHVRVDGVLQRTGCDKFGALLGDQCRIGANAVLAPGAVLMPASVVSRGQVFDGEKQ